VKNEKRVWIGFWLGAIIALSSGLIVHNLRPGLLNLLTHSIIAGLITSLGIAIGYVAQARADHDETLEDFKNFRNFDYYFIPTNLRQERVDTVLGDLASKYEKWAKEIDVLLRGGLDKFPGKEGESREEMRQRYDRQREHLEKLADEALEYFRAAWDCVYDVAGAELLLEDRDPSDYLSKPDKKTPAA
jgi:hypothetical protein